MTTPGYEKVVGISFGENQKVTGVDSVTTMRIIEEMVEYMTDTVYANTNMQDVASECQVRNELCAFWAAIGECKVNPSYMKLQCAPACKTCDQLSYETRCPFSKDAPTAWDKGDLNKMFERITTSEEFQKYSPTIYSSPNDPNKPGPWVVTLDDVATQEECDALIELGAKQGYERSKDVGGKKFDGTYDAVQSDFRTSSNAWCVKDCYNHTVTQSVLDKQAWITGIPDKNNEYLQLLKYTEGQRYGQHHDFIQHHNARPQGPRILTVFFYLNDVEEGGGTKFNKLGITVMPKRGRVLLWPSVSDQFPNRKDSRTDHEALPVIKGIKYGANSWVHQNDFKTPFAEGCI
eukprot:CAMPEP_0198134680 /NCGR_PEP_ID=MMETSP1442-20131203/60200_1 /TAXON_ID= /ORGANISM="Craspedostauros australis, Strain CCMP3328" /LENGTH=346 /DNA_ID=CAMNT_0043795827 /DNA_START=313 /DNA_END=1353 /DNA_ORIENTATION=+